MNTTSGSIAYNRLEMQVSQTLLFAIELYDTPDYLIVLDYYDDISIFQSEQNSSVVSYYQMKTDDTSLTLHYVFEKQWLSKLYEHVINKNEEEIKELGIIVCDPIKDASKIIFSRNKEKFIENKSKIQNKIKEDIAEKLNINSAEVDISNFVYIKTELSRNKHREIVKDKLNKLLLEINPKISLEAANTVFNSLFVMLTQLQSHELRSDEKKETVKNTKGITKEKFSKTIEYVNMIVLPEFSTIERIIKDKDIIEKIAFTYLKILEDSRKNLPQFKELMLVLNKKIKNGYSNELSVINKAEQLKNEIIHEGYSGIYLNTEKYYIETLIICLLAKGA